jgi:hypothetical protein
MLVHTRRWVSLAVFSAAVILPRAAVAQSATFEACSQGALANCALIRSTETLGIGPGGTNLFEIALQNLGSQSTPSLATSIYFLAFLTGQPAATPGTEVDALATPTAQGGATVSDPSSWSVFESGDAIFLSALGNNGVGGCATSSPVGGFGQMGQTCGADDFITFSFFTTRTFDVGALSLADLEFVGVSDGNPADSCNDGTPCKITPITSTPEPATIALMVTGFAGVARLRLRRRATRASSATIASEV